MSQQYLIQVVNIGLVCIKPSFTAARTAFLLIEANSATEVNQKPFEQK